MLTITPLSIPAVRLVESPINADDRGRLVVAWSEASFASAGLDEEFVQDNATWSARNCVRAFHFQRQFPQGRLIRCLHGSIYDVAVDVRRDSPSFGRWVAHTLTADSGAALWIPPGFAHGYCVTSEGAVVHAKVTAPFHPEDGVTFRWNDPTLGIPWPLTGPPIVSSRDAAAPLFAGIDA